MNSLKEITKTSATNKTKETTTHIHWIFIRSQSRKHLHHQLAKKNRKRTLHYLKVNVKTHKKGIFPVFCQFLPVIFAKMDSRHYKIIHRQNKN